MHVEIVEQFVHNKKSVIQQDFLLVTPAGVEPVLQE